MIYKGHVLLLEKDYAVVMTDTAAYVKVIARKGLAVGERIIFTDEDLLKKKWTVATKTWKYAAACVLLLFIAVLQLYLSNIGRTNGAIAAVVSLDINPSIEIEINNKGEVINYIPLNYEGNVILDTRPEGKPVSEAVCKLLENAADQGYLEDEKSSVLVSLSPLITGLDVSLEDIEADILSFTNGNSRLAGIDLMFVYGSKAILEDARRSEVSPGRYFMYKKLKESETDLKIETVRTMELKKLFNRFRHGQGDNDQIKTFSESDNGKFLYEAVYEQIQLRYRMRNMEMYQHQIEPQIQERIQSQERIRVGDEKENTENGMIQGSEIQDKLQGTDSGQNSSKEGSGEGKGAQGGVDDGSSQVLNTSGEPQAQEQNYGIDIRNSTNENPAAVITPETEESGDNGNKDEEKDYGDKNQEGRPDKPEKGNKK